jgi:hypothetical protein
MRRWLDEGGRAGRVVSGRIEIVWCPGLMLEEGEKRGREKREGERKERGEGRTVRRPRDATLANLNVVTASPVMPLGGGVRAIAMARWCEAPTQRRREVG